MEKVYIASPFFDETSKAWVTNRENEYEGFKIDYFSPRQDGVDFHEKTLSLQERSNRIKMIFKNNIKGLDMCNKMVANLNPCNGKIDIGTLWEIGYFMGNECNSRSIQIFGDNFVVNRIKSLISNLSTIKITRNKKSLDTPLRVVCIPEVENDVRKAVKFSDRIFRNIESLDLYTIKTWEVEAVESLVILTDDYPLEMYLFMGFLYAKDIDYYTCSLRGFGSNIMIAASSQGHINIPGVVLDDTYRKDLL